MRDPHLFEVLRRNGSALREKGEMNPLNRTLTLEELKILDQRKRAFLGREKIAKVLGGERLRRLSDTPAGDLVKEHESSSKSALVGNGARAEALVKAYLRRYKMRMQTEAHPEFVEELFVHFPRQKVHAIQRRLVALRKSETPASVFDLERLYLKLRQSDSGDWKKAVRQYLPLVSSPQRRVVFNHLTGKTEPA